MVTWRQLSSSTHPRRAGATATGADRLAEKYGMTVEQPRPPSGSLKEVAAGEGLDFRFDSTHGSIYGKRLMYYLIN